jgi:hypothetical protein
VSTQVVVEEIPFVITVGGGWGQAGNDVIVELTKEPIEAYVWIEKEGLEPPLWGSTRVYVDGNVITEWEKLIQIPTQKTYRIYVEKTGWGWVGGFTCTGYIKAVFQKAWYEPSPGGVVKQPIRWERILKELKWVFLVGGVALILILLLIILKVR